LIWLYSLLVERKRGKKRAREADTEAYGCNRRRAKDCGIVTPCLTRNIQKYLSCQAIQSMVVYFPGEGKDGKTKIEREVLEYSVMYRCNDRLRD
jgi:hypothetical protein